MALNFTGIDKRSKEEKRFMNVVTRLYSKLGNIKMEVLLSLFNKITIKT